MVGWLHTWLGILVIVVAVLSDGAAFTLGVACLADGASMPDELKVEGVVFLWGDDGFHDRMGVIGANFGWQESQTDANAVDVCIDGEGGHTIGKAEDDGGCFGSDAGELL